METCSDCRHNVNGYCDEYDQNVNPDMCPCPEFEEK
jgi:hypothetical protein